MKKVVFIKGISNSRYTKILRTNPLQVLNRGNSAISYYFNERNIQKSTLLFADKFNQKIDSNLMVNEIADADSHSSSLKRLNELFPNGNFINHPKQVLRTTRDGIYNLLKNVKNLTVPKVVRLTPLSPTDITSTIFDNSFTYPVIIRECGSQLGENTYLVHSEREVNELYAIPLDGRDFYITQYHDSERDGLYKKFRLVVIDGEVFLLHCVFSEKWMIHLKDRRGGVFLERELEVLEKFETEIKPLIKDTINEIYEELKLDYFGIDCDILGDQILIFEINSCMNILKFYLPELDTHRLLVLDATTKMIKRKIKW